MPKNSMKTFAVTLIPKSVQFSKAKRIEETDLVWGESPYETYLFVARTEDEAETIAKKYIGDAVRAIVTMVGEPSFVLIPGRGNFPGSEA